MVISKYYPKVGELHKLHNREKAWVAMQKLNLAILGNFTQFGCVVLHKLNQPHLHNAHQKSADVQTKMLPLIVG